jgi:hypothetical protein
MLFLGFEEVLPMGSLSAVLRNGASLKTNHTILFCIQKLQSKCEQWRHVRHVALNSHGTQ